MKKYNLYMGDRKNVNFPTGIKAIIGEELAFLEVKEDISPESIVCFLQKDMPDVETITMPDSVQIVGPKAFKNCRNLKSIYFSKNLEQICVSAFLNCTNVKSIRLPKSIIKIEAWAFGSYELEDVFYEGTIFDFDKVETRGAFLSIKKLHCTDCTVDFTQRKYYIKELKFNGTVGIWQQTMSEHWLNRRSSKIVCSDGIIEK